MSPDKMAKLPLQVQSHHHCPRRQRHSSHSSPHRTAQSRRKNRREIPNQAPGQHQPNVQESDVK